jgi:hypothetical protein
MTAFDKAFLALSLCRFVALSVCGFVAFANQSKRMNGALL